MKHLILLSVFIPLLVFASPGHEMKPYQGSKEFQKIKSLAGDWEGTVNSPEQNDDKVKVTYHVTANGSAVVETIFKETPMEMVSVYYEEEGELVMTHYCAVANQPKLKVSKSDGGNIEFDYASGTNLDASKDMHIHGLALNISGDKMQQVWSGKTGKEEHKTIMDLKKVKK